MSNFALTPSQVVPLTPPLRAIAGVAIAAGDVIDEDPATGRMILADADLGYVDTARNGRARGIATSTSAIGQPVFYVPTGGSVRLSDAPIAEAVSFSPVFLANAAGKMRPFEDVIASPSVATFLGMLNGNQTILRVNIDQPTGPYND